MATNVTKIVTMPYLEAFDRLYKAIVNSGYDVSLANPQQGVIKFDSQPSATDWGFDFVAQIFSPNPTTTQINFSGSVKFGIDAFKVGNKKIEKLMLSF